MGRKLYRHKKIKNLMERRKYYVLIFYYYYVRFTTVVASEGCDITVNINISH